MGTNKEMYQYNHTPPSPPKPDNIIRGADKLKKKWVISKKKTKVNNMCIFDQETYNRVMRELSNHRIVTPSILSVEYGISVSLARKAIKEAEENAIIRMVSGDSTLKIYTPERNV